MKRVLNGMALVTVACVLTGCAKQSDFKDLQTQVRVWAHGGTYGSDTYEGVVDWQRRTHQAICELYEKNTPDRASSASPSPGSSTGTLTETSYTTALTTYCGTTEGNGDPDDPPPFGA